MPIYEYECTGCHHTFDFMQKMNDEPLKQCPQCHQNKVVRLVSAAGFQLKGSGWYETDFKNKGMAPKKNETSTPSPEAKESSPKTDAASSTKTTTTGEKE